jgi:predicted kinase
MNFAILISGLPGTGKSHLATMLAEKLSVPYVSKDGFKELLFDTLGWNDREWSRKLGNASMRMLDYVLLSHIRVGSLLIIEGNFKPEFENKRFSELAANYDITFLQVNCWAEGPVLLERFKQRAESEERHPGHADAYNIEEFRSMLLRGKAETLDIPGHVIELETTDFSKVDYETLIGTIRTMIAAQEKHLPG